jgi:transposase-like protein
MGNEHYVNLKLPRDILGPWAGDGSEGAKYWLQVLAEIKNQALEDICMVICDGLKCRSHGSYDLGGA